MPSLGLGTWQSPLDEVAHAVKTALQTGYRAIDTASAYHNEEGVGRGIRDSGIPRSEIFLTTKLNVSDTHRAAEALDEQLARLGTDYLDLYLVHWPVCVDPTDAKKALDGWDYVKTWLSMQDLLAAGKVRAIGVSNFQIYHLEKLFAHPDFKVIPAVNQLELHPYNPSPKLVAFCKEKGIHLTAYAPIGGAGSTLLKDPVVAELAEKYGKTPAQVLLRWGIQKGYDVIPKSVSENRIKENWRALGWSLEEGDVERLSKVETRQKVYRDHWLPERVFVGDDE